MPGPVSDSYDHEWGTSASAAMIDEALAEMYAEVSELLENDPPIYLLDLLKRRDERFRSIDGTFSEKQWRIIRFALERARESI